MTDSDHINSYVSKTFNAISCLYKNDFIEAALLHTYVAIDQMSWLAIAGEDANAKNFKEWVQVYITPSDTLGCSADDLWAARNGLVHMGAAESKDFKNGKAKKIFYVVGRAICTENRSEDTIVIDVTAFISAFCAGALRFSRDLDKDASRLSIAILKVGSMLSYRPLTNK